MKLELMSVAGSIQSPLFSVSAKSEGRFFNWLQKKTSNYEPIVCDHEGNRYEPTSEVFQSMQALSVTVGEKKASKAKSKSKKK